MTQNKEQMPKDTTIQEAIKKASTEMLVLYFLRQKNMYTYELIGEIKKQSEGMFAYNTLYIAIYRLQEKGYIVETDKIVTSDNRTRVYFGITEGGQVYLQNSINVFHDTVGMLTDLLAKDGKLYTEDTNQ